MTKARLTKARHGGDGAAVAADKPGDAAEPAVKAKAAPAIRLRDEIESWVNEGGAGDDVTLGDT